MLSSDPFNTLVREEWGRLRLTKLSNAAVAEDKCRSRGACQELMGHDCLIAKDREQSAFMGEEALVSNKTLISAVFVGQA